MRADAQRNRDALVAAARAEFAERGPDAPLDDVARRAGVGNATLYRHFPTRDELVVAVYAEEVAELCRAGELSGEDPADALFGWLAGFRRHVAAKRDLALALAAGARRAALFEDWHAAMRHTASALLDRAQRAGTITPDTSVPDLLAAVNGIALAATDEAQAERLLNVLRAGLRAG